MNPHPRAILLYHLREILKRQEKMHMKMSSAEVVCYKLLPNITVELKQSVMGPRYLPKRLLKHFSRREKRTTFVVIGALRVKSQFRLLLVLMFKSSVMLPDTRVSSEKIGQL